MRRIVRKEQIGPLGNVVTKQSEAMQSPKTPPVSTPKSGATRKRAYRQRLAVKGFAYFNVAIDPATARRLRGIAKKHQRPMAEVIAMGALLSQRALSGTAATTAE